MSFYTPLRVEADQKEVIIQQLKGDLYNLKRNEQEYLQLQEQFRKLEAKYRVLQDEKALVDGDFRSRHDQAIRSISQLKNEVDALRAQLRDRTLELGDLTTDGNTLRNQLDQRNIEIERLKTDINSYLADSEELLTERARLQQQFSTLKADKLRLLDDLKNLEADNDSVARKTHELEKYIGQVDGDGKLLRDRILKYENENNALDDEISKLNDALTELDRLVLDQQKELKALQNDLASLQSINDKHRSELSHFHKASQSEAMKNAEIAKALSQAEGTLRAREGHIAEAGRTIRQLDEENQSLNSLNSRLDVDLEELRKHLQNLTLLNSNLVAELERYNAEDETVRALISRQSRVLRARARVEQLTALSRTTTAFASSSPPKSRLIRRSKIY